MKFTSTEIDGLVLIELEERSDDRGFFARTFCAREFEAAGLTPVVAQANLAYSHRAGTMRGLHYQLPPAAEAKLLRVTRGSVFDVAVDLRPESPTYLQHVGLVLSSDDRRAIYVPEGFAHGYLTLTDHAEVTYQVSEFYTPGVERGLRWDDPSLGIAWPRPITIVSDKDRSWPDLER